jgi:hypothetical protein
LLRQRNSLTNLTITVRPDEIALLDLLWTPEARQTSRSAQLDR